MNELNSSLEAAIVGRSLDSVKFSQPWMARAFAITLATSEAAHFTLQEFQVVLIEKIKASELRGALIINEEHYYTCWMDALTQLLQGKTVMTSRALELAEKRVQDRLVSLQHDHHHHALRIEDVKPVYRESGKCS